MITNQKIIEETFNEINIKCIFRENHESQWIDLTSSFKYMPIDYLNSNIEYLNEYNNQNYDEMFDCSCILLSDNKPIALWPLTIGNKNKASFLTSQDSYILPPIFNINCPKKTSKSVYKQAFSVLNKISTNNHIKEWNTSTPYMGLSGLDDWHLLCMKNGASCSVIHNLYVDLKKDLEKIKLDFRKSYRPLVTKGNRIWTTKIHTSTIDSVTWKEFKNLHLKAAGRITRSDESWDVQFKIIIKNNGFLVSIYNEDAKMVGGALIVCSANEGRYEIAAYDRDLFDRPLGHLVMFKAIEESKKRGFDYYIVGRRFFESDNPKPTKKEISISEFKEGFTTYNIPSYIITNKTV